MKTNEQFDKAESNFFLHAVTDSLAKWRERATYIQPGTEMEIHLAEGTEFFLVFGNPCLPD